MPNFTARGYMQTNQQGFKTPAGILEVQSFTPSYSLPIYTVSPTSGNVLQPKGKVGYLAGGWFAANGQWEFPQTGSYPVAPTQSYILPAYKVDSSISTTKSAMLGFYGFPIFKVKSRIAAAYPPSKSQFLKN